MIVDMKPIAYVLVWYSERITSRRRECSAQWIPIQGAVEKPLLSIDPVDVFDGQLNTKIVSDSEVLA